MPAIVVTSANLAELASTGKVDQSKSELPPTTREKIALKRSGITEPKLESKQVVPTADSSKEEIKEDSSKKLDEPAKAVVQDKSAEPSAKPKDDDTSEDDLPERARKVIGKKHRQMKEAEEFATLQRGLRLEAEKRVKELEAQLASATPKQAKPESDTSRGTGDEPKPEDFPNVAAYAKALVKWEREQERSERAQQQVEQSKAEDTERRSKSQAAWKERLDAVMEEEPDYEEAVTKAFAANDKPIAITVLDTIEESELGPRMLYHMAKHPDELATFRSLNAEKQIKFLGRLEAKLEAKAKPKADPEPEKKPDPPVKEAKSEITPPAKNVSKAPPPTDTSVGTGEPVTKSPADMTTAEYLAWKRSQRRAAGAR